MRHFALSITRLPKHFSSTLRRYPNRTRKLPANSILSPSANQPATFRHLATMNGAAQVNGGGSPSTLTNYVAFLRSDSTVPQIGHLDSKSLTVQPLAFLSGTPLSNLYQVIEIGEKNIIPAGEPVDSTSVKILPPISGRDVLAVGKNYSEHAKEFNTSGYDSSDKVDIPTHPVIFSKRATSIIGDNEEIYPHPKFTQSLDYEGEIGVIIGKPGFRVGVDEAMDYVWGYTIINDMTARERQRDHKQFYIGKSPDTFCPMVCHLLCPDNFSS